MQGGESHGYCRACGAELGQPAGDFCPSCGFKLAGKQPEETRSGIRPLVIGGAVVLVIVLAAIVLVSGIGSSDGDSSAGSGSEISSEPLPAPSELPADVVAVVSHVPEQLRTIDEDDLDRAIEQVAAQKKLKTVPAPGSPEYAEIEEAALGEIIDRAWISGQAAAMGITLTEDEIAKELATIKDQNFKSEEQYQDFLESSKLSEPEVRDRVELQLFSTKIQEKNEARTQGGEAAKQKAFAAFVSDYQKRWRARTVCAKQHLNERCSNGPPPQTASSG